jgi:hypothetical protein
MATSPLPDGSADRAMAASSTTASPDGRLLPKMSATLGGPPSMSRRMDHLAAAS